MQSYVSLRVGTTPSVTPLLFLLSILLLAFLPAGCSSNHDAVGLSDITATHAAHHHGGSSSDVAIDPAKLLADKQESEFNHHLAGLFIAVAGVLILAQERLARRWPFARYAWPFCFLLAGLFVLVFSDTEIWPWGTQSLYYALAHNPEDLQHKAFALILILVAWFEIQSLRGQASAAWSVWAFPALSFAGAVLLLFHSHQTGMDGPNGMAVMEHIEWQHRWYASIGFGIVLTRGLSQTKINCRSMLGKTWPLLLIVLGTSLTLYTE